MFAESEFAKIHNRRTFLTRSTTGIGMAALASLLGKDLSAAAAAAPGLAVPGMLKTLHWAPKAKRVIYLFQSGAPSHMDLFDPKPHLRKVSGTELPASIRMGQRITGMTSGQKQFLCVGSAYPFKRYGKCGTEMSEILSGIGAVADELCVSGITDCGTTPCLRMTLMNMFH